MQQLIFIADCSTCFGHHYAHHQELESIIQKFAVCGIILSSSCEGRLGRRRTGRSACATLAAAPRLPAGCLVRNWWRVRLRSQSLARGREVVCFFGN